MSEQASIVDLFAGPGGWDEGLRLLDVHSVIGIEWDKDAVATAVAAGHRRIGPGPAGDVTQINPRDVVPGVCRGLIASPPCQSFSAAGKGEGVADLADLGRALRHVADGHPTAVAGEMAGLDVSDPRSVLVLEPMRYIRDLRPSWVACEEVKEVLPVWQEYAEILRRMGYSAWAGILNAADYGVPQKRRRAFLMASRHGHVTRPPQTHAEGGDVSLFGELPPWVTMAEALSLGPRPDDLTAWAWDRPATTVVRSFRPDIIAAPGYRQAGDGPRQNTPGSIPVTDEQMCILQGIRTDYPFTARGKTKRQSLIGAILPPPWAAAILAPLIAMQPPMVCIECGNDDATSGYDYCSDCLEVAA